MLKNSRELDIIVIFWLAHVDMISNFQEKIVQIIPNIFFSIEIDYINIVRLTLHSVLWSQDARRKTQNRGAIFEIQFCCFYKFDRFFNAVAGISVKWMPQYDMDLKHVLNMLATRFTLDLFCRNLAYQIQEEVKQKVQGETLH